jgi:TonB family protein
MKMRKKLRLPLSLGFLLLGSLITAVGQEQRIVSLEMPAHPPLARQARVQGAVTVEIEVDEDGVVSLANLVDGHPLLKAEAIHNVRTWKFRAGAPLRTTVIFDFRMRDEPAPTPSIRVVFDSYRRVEITTDPPLQLPLQKHPIY